MDESSTSTGQVVASAAEVYDSFFVPALFGQWPETVLDAAEVAEGAHILDVGCGTGVLARAATRRVGPTGAVTGVDVNDGMLTVARRSPEPVTWEAAPAEALPFPDAVFDRVVSQFALMFFRDRTKALEEIARVTRPGGRVALATWAAISESPGYAAMQALLARLFGDAAADALRAPFSLGSEPDLRELVDRVFGTCDVRRYEGTARFESIDAWVHTDVRGWTLADTIDDDQYGELVAAARHDLKEFVDRDGRVAFAAPALIATATV